jgi:hypothetical protein
MIGARYRQALALNQDLVEDGNEAPARRSRPRFRGRASDMLLNNTPGSGCRPMHLAGCIRLRPRNVN